jgi:hypothetical protein
MLNTAELSQATENLYVVFAHYPLRLAHVCPCCGYEEQVEQLKSTPLRELTHDQLFPLVHFFEGTFGDLRDLKHCLPRIAELRAAFDLEQVLARAHSLSWPWAEWQAIDGFRVEQIVARLLRDEVDVLADVANFAHVLTPRLARFLDASDLAPRWYAQLICELGQRHDRFSDHEAVLVDWLLQDRRVEALERAFFVESHGHAQQLFSSAVQVLEWF